MIGLPPGVTMMRDAGNSQSRRCPMSAAIASRTSVIPGDGT